MFYLCFNSKILLDYVLYTLPYYINQHDKLNNTCKLYISNKNKEKYMVYKLRYKCVNGSEFDTDSDGQGDTIIIIQSI